MRHLFTIGPVSPRELTAWIELDDTDEFDATEHLEDTRTAA